MLHLWSLYFYNEPQQRCIMCLHVSHLLPILDSLGEACLLQWESLQLTYACLAVDVFSISTSLGSPKSPEVTSSGVDLTYIPQPFGFEVVTDKTVGASAIGAVFLKGTSSTFLQWPSVSSPILRLWALRTGRLLPPGNTPDTPFC